uniref:Uncharacterized protein n=1 Tax=Glossina austeni TaxID=7395 RepID=A0A1A9VSH4_GLOAU
MQAQKIIVIHPGSLYLRIGRASDLNPTTILHAIGKRRRKNLKNNENFIYSDYLLPPLVAGEAQEGIMTQFNENSVHAAHSIQAHVAQYEDRQGGLKRLRMAPQKVASFNKNSTPQVISDDGLRIQEEGKESEFIFNSSILSLNAQEASAYNIHFPLRRGELNIHSGIGGSLTSILSDLESIWSYAIEKHMNIPRKQLNQYGAVLVISDIYNRSSLRELVTLLLQCLGFRACFLLQDHVAATFGAGLGYACVVDVGDQKCSISCVEDGVSHPDTRVRLGYGGGDVTQVFLTLLQKNNFPYKKCNVNENYSDAALVMSLKESMCHLNLEICETQEKSFEVEKPPKRFLYTFHVSDECKVAPLSLFHTELLNITGKQRLVRLQLPSSQQPDSQDCFDAEYIRETGRVRGGRGDQILEGSMPVTCDAGDDELVVVDAFDVDERVVNPRNVDKDEQLYYFTNNGEVVSLDLAIVRSIERCTSDDMKRKMYGCILLVGGASKLLGFSKWLEQKITLQLAANTVHNRSTEQSALFDVNVCVKEMDAAMIAWKGAAIMSCLESAPELWIFGKEWKKYGLRILREKATFIW